MSGNLKEKHPFLAKFLIVSFEIFKVLVSSLLAPLIVCSAILTMIIICEAFSDLSGFIHAMTYDKDVLYPVSYMFGVFSILLAIEIPLVYFCAKYFKLGKGYFFLFLILLSGLYTFLYFIFFKPMFYI